MNPPQGACPIRDAMSEGRQAGGFVASRASCYPKPEPVPGTLVVRGYRTCPCGRLFPLYALPGRPPMHCFNHRGTRSRNLAGRRRASLYPHG